MSGAHSEFFFWGGLQISILTFSRAFFSGGVTLKKIEEQKTLKGVRGHATLEIF